MHFLNSLKGLSKSVFVFGSITDLLPSWLILLRSNRTVHLSQQTGRQNENSLTGHLNWGPKDVAVGPTPPFVVRGKARTLVLFTHRFGSAFPIKFTFIGGHLQCCLESCADFQVVQKDTLMRSLPWVEKPSMGDCGFVVWRRDGTPRNTVIHIGVCCRTGKQTKSDDDGRNFAQGLASVNIQAM